MSQFRMGMTEREDTSYANGFQALDLTQKKKKKNKRKSEAPNEEPILLSEEAPIPPDPSSLVNLVPKKKKKRRHRASDEEVCILETLEVVPGLSEATDGEEVEQDHESPPLKKKKKKKKKKRRSELLNGDAISPSEEAVRHSPVPSHPSSFVSWQVETQDTEGGTAPGRKKKKTGEERCECQESSSWIIPESELNIEVGGDLVSKKKKKRKHRSSDEEVCVPETLEVVPGFSEATDGEGVEQDHESPPLKKKKKKKKKKRKELSAEEEEGRGISSQPMHEETEWAEAQDPSQAHPSDEEGSLDLFPLEAENGSAGSGPPDESDGPAPRKKKRRQRGNARSKVDGEFEQDRRPQTTSLAHPSVDAPPSPASETSPVIDEDFLAAFSVPPRDLEAVRKELEEFIPHVQTLSDKAVRQLASRDLDRFKRFKEKGIAIRSGRFSKKEDELLRKNIEAFLEESGIETVERLLFTHRFPEEKAELNRLKAKHLLGLRIAEGIPRPWRLVYYHGRRLFDPQNYKGKYSEEEKKQLKKYHTMYGNSWTKISGMMCRSTRSLEQKYSNMRSDPKVGAWSDEETEKLNRAVAEVLREKANSAASAPDPEQGDGNLLLDRDMIYKSIPWSQIEAEVETRHWKQCRKKWFSIVARRLGGGKRKRNRLENIRFRIKLIRRLNKLDVEEESEINWEDVSSAMGNLPPSYVQNRYYKMKTAYVPFWNRRSFSEIMYVLYKKKLPQLKAQVKRTVTEEKAAATAKEQDTFLFSQLFPDTSQDLLADSEESEEE